MRICPKRKEELNVFFPQVKDTVVVKRKENASDCDLQNKIKKCIESGANASHSHHAQRQETRAHATVNERYRCVDRSETTTRRGKVTRHVNRDAEP